MSIPRIVISGTNSGCGKTTVSTGIMAALVKRGLNVQPFKVGPDYIDPMFHTFITHRYSRNLDSYLLTEETVAALFAKNSADADIAVIEGVMGLYDGFGGDSTLASTAHVSKILNAPVILVMNAAGMSLSAVAVIQGFCSFEGGVDIRGVILNNIKNDSTYLHLKKIIEANTSVRVLGYLPQLLESSLKSRHLGLVTSEEIDDLESRIEAVRAQVEKTIDMDALIALAKESAASELPKAELPEPKAGSPVIVGVAMDKAFCFYYRDNLELLEQLGASLKYFSPLSDARLPDEIDGLYIGGGYPEVWVEALGANAAMKEDIKRQVSGGLPTYAECGGLMYLSESICDPGVGEVGMVGLIPAKSCLTTSLQHFGYIEVEIEAENILADRGDAIRGHEFHYSVTPFENDEQTCYLVKKKRNGKESAWRCGYQTGNLLAGYPHLHFWSNPRFAENFVDSCRRYHTRKSGGIQ